MFLQGGLPSFLCGMWHSSSGAEFGPPQVKAISSSGAAELFDRRIMSDPRVVEFASPAAWSVVDEFGPPCHGTKRRGRKELVLHRKRRIHKGITG